MYKIPKSLIEEAYMRPSKIISSSLNIKAIMLHIY